MRFVVVEKHRGATAKCQSFKKEISFFFLKRRNKKSRSFSLRLNWTDADIDCELIAVSARQ
jgi:hypothetical protein